MPWSATHRFARISPTKARLVADLIRGRHVNEALDVLAFTKKRASGMVGKVLRSAIANADEQEADVNSLFVHEVRVDEGPRLKRWRPWHRGRIQPYIHRTSHIVVTVEEQR
jgi:large subunit ribosomal protein L22